MHKTPLEGTTGSASTQHRINFTSKSEGKDVHKTPQTHIYLQSSCSPAAISAIDHVLTICTARTRSCQRWEAVECNLVRLLMGNSDFAGRHSSHWAVNQRAQCMPMGTRVVSSCSLPVVVATQLARADTSSSHGTL